MSLEDKERIADVARAYAKHDVVIAEVGRWCNLLDADPANRKKNLDRVIEGLALAAAGGGSMVAALGLPRLLDRIADRPTMLSGALIMAAGIGLIATGRIFQLLTSLVT